MLGTLSTRGTTILLHLNGPFIVLIEDCLFDGIALCFHEHFDIEGMCDVVAGTNDVCFCGAFCVNFFTCTHPLFFSCSQSKLKCHQRRLCCCFRRTLNEDWKSKKLFDNEDGVFSFECFTGPFCNKEDTVAAQHLSDVMESSADAFINGGKKGKHVFAISKMELQYIAGGIHCVSPVLPCAKSLSTKSQDPILFKRSHMILLEPKHFVNIIDLGALEAKFVNNFMETVPLAGDPGYCTLAICMIIVDADVIKMGDGKLEIGMVHKIFVHIIIPVLDPNSVELLAAHAKDNILSNSRVAKGFANLELLNPGDEKARYHIRGLGQPAAGEFKKSLQQKIKTMKHFTGDDESADEFNGGELGPFLNSLPVNSNSKEFLSGCHNWGWTPVAAALDEVANEVVVEVVVKGVNDSFEKS